MRVNGGNVLCIVLCVNSGAPTNYFVFAVWCVFLFDVYCTNAPFARLWLGMEHVSASCVEKGRYQYEEVSVL